ncbi:hypothetical protein K7432_003503 [Basidiobolus ranarum]|uniref:Uncharacterized protein n=1 Tax=Basidiobolus ranarum TaxID=34480 RepID=A0ABR2W637_9FUNG
MDVHQQHSSILNSLLDTHNPSDFSISLEDVYRLVIIISKFHLDCLHSEDALGATLTEESASYEDVPEDFDHNPFDVSQDERVPTITLSYISSKDEETCWSLQKIYSLSHSESERALYTALLTILECTDSERGWRSYLQSWDISNRPTVVTKKFAAIKESKITTLFVECLLRLILGFHKVSNNNSLKQEQYQIQRVGVSILGSLIWERIVDSSLAQVVNLLGSLTELLGWPQLLPRTDLGTAVPHTEFQESIPEAGVLGSEFYLQTLVWRVIQLLDATSYHYQHLPCRVTTSRNISHLFLWTANYAQYFPREDLSYSYYHSTSSPDQSRTKTGGSFASAILTTDFKDTDYTEYRDTPPQQHSFNLLEETSLSDIPDVRTKELDILFEIAFMCCMVSEKEFNQEFEQGDEKDSPSHQESVPSFFNLLDSTIQVLFSELSKAATLPPEWDEIFHMLSRTLINDCSESMHSSRNDILSQETRQKLQMKMASKSILPRIQYYMLEFFTRIIDYKEGLENAVFRRRLWCMRLLSETRFWDVLFSDFFFMWGENIEKGRVEGVSLKKVRSSFKMVILRFVIYTSTLESFNNQNQCSQLLTILHTSRQRNAQFTIDVLKALVAIILLKRHVTQESLRQLHCLSEFLPLLHEAMEDQQGMSFVEVVDSSFTAHDHNQTLWLLVSILDSLIIGHREMTILLYREPHCLELFEQLLWSDNQIISQFAISHLANMLAVVPLELTECAGDVVREYFRLFPEEISTTSTFDVQINLLKGLRSSFDLYSGTTSCNYRCERKMLRKIFLEERCLEYILDVLDMPLELPFMNTTKLVSYRSALCLEVIYTLTAVLWEFDEAKRLLRRINGYHKITRHLIGLDAKLTIELFDGLFGMLVDLETWSPEKAFNIENKDVISLLIGVHPIMDLQMQLLMLNRFIELIDYNDLNKWVLCQSSVLSKLLKNNSSMESVDYVTKLVYMLESISSYSINISNIKFILNTLCYENQEVSEECKRSRDVLRPYHGPLLKMILSLAQKDTNLDFFLFKGMSSGISVPNIGRIHSGGYTFFTWICIQPALRIGSSCEPHRGYHDGSEKYCPRVYSFVTSKGNGVEVFFNGNTLELHVSKESLRRKVVVPTPKFIHNRWHFIAISHFPVRRRLSSQSEVNIYVDGLLSCKSQIDFALPGTEVSKCIIGGMVNPVLGECTRGSICGNTQGAFTQCFRGKMSAIYLVEEPLTAQQIKGIYSLGRNLSTQFRPEELNEHPKAPSSLFDGNIASRILVNLHPRASKHHNCINLAPRLAQSTTQQAIILVNVEKCSTISLQSALHALGGIEIFFPLILRCDVLDASTYSAPFGSQDEFFIRNGPIDSFFALIASLLRNNKRNQESILKARGIKTISLLLQQIDPRHLSISAFQSMITLINSVPDNKELIDRIYKHLIFEFRLWVYTSYETQTYILGYLLSFIMSHTKMCREELGVNFFFDTLRVYYWYSPGDYSCSPKHPCTAEVRPSMEIIADLRKQIFKIIEYFVKDNITMDEFIGLIKSLLTGDDTKHVQELFELMLRLLEGPPGVSVVDYLISYGGYEILIELLKHEDSIVKIHCLKVIIFLITSPDIPERWKRKLKLEDTYCGTLGSLVGNTPLDHELYEALLEFCVESDKKVHIASSKSLSNIKAQNPRVFACILMMLSHEETDDSLKVQVLRELVQLVEISPKFCLDFDRTCSDWTTLLVRLIPYDSCSKTDKLDYDIATAIGALAIDLLIRIAWHLFDSNRYAFNVVKDSAIYLWTSYRSDHVEVIRSLLFKVLVLIRSDVQNELPKISQIKMNNITSLLCFIEDYLFNFINLDDVVPKQNPLYNWTTPCSSVTTLNITGPDSVLVPAEIPEPLMLKATVNPWEECYDLADIYCQVIVYFDTISFPRASPRDFSGMKPGGLCSMALRILLCSFYMDETPLDLESRNQMFISHLKRHLTSSRSSFTPIFQSTNGEYCSESQNLRPYILPIVGALHEAFVKLNSAENGPGYQEFLELYSFVFNKYRDTLKNADKKIFGAYLDSSWPDIETNIRVFEKFICSNRWADFFDQHLFPAVKSIEEQQLEWFTKSAILFSKEVKTFLRRLRKEDINQVQCEQALSQSVGDVIKSYREEEMDRLNSLVVERKQLQSRLMWQWLVKLQELTHERESWFEGNGTQTRWKLDKIENYSRMRKKLTINYDFDDHKDASAKRDKSRLETSNFRNKRFSLSKARSNPPDLGVDETLLKLLFSSDQQNQEEADEEEWNMIDEDLQITTDDQSERNICSVECEMITLLTVIKGHLELNTGQIRFIVDRAFMLEQIADPQTAQVLDNDIWRDRLWPVSDLREIYFRKYMLRKTALELFMMDQTNYFFNFPVAKERLRFYSCIMSLKPAALINSFVRSPSHMLKNSNLTERWQRREISNFDYLMQLNSIAGRTYNDLTQYFVFPWVLVDYESEKLDLTNPKIYRDFSKPVGALNETRLQQFIERYNYFDDPCIPKFHYGTHYSSAASVAYYLLRLEPFTSIHLALQGGKFDHADRQFHSIQECWFNCTNASGDVKELIPEFFYMPEFLVNINNFDLGVKQTGTRVDDIVLPKWAKSPEEFVRIHREALESDHVSENIHKWIDLIFGYKQRGEEAAKAHNLFYYLTYEGAVNLDNVQDPMERKAIESQIYHFGQTPTQLFTREHPVRFPRAARYIPRTIFTSPDKHKKYMVNLRSKRISYIAVCCNLHTSLSLDHQYQVVTIDQDGIISAHVYKETSSSNMPFSLEIDPMLESGRRISSPFGFEANITPRCFGCSNDGQYIFSGGHWDNTFKVVLVESGKIIRSVTGHDDIVTCLALSEDGKILVTGSRSTTLLSWNIEFDSNGTFIKDVVPKLSYYGHNNEVICVAANVEYDILISGSKDGTCVVHSLRQGHYIRTLCPVHDVDASVNVVRISKQGNILIYSESQESASLHVFNINGRLLKSLVLLGHLNDMIFSKEGDYLIAADCHANVLIYRTYDLKLHCTFETPIPAYCISFSKSQHQMFLGGDDGKLIVLSMNL